MNPVVLGSGTMPRGTSNFDYQSTAMGLLDVIYIEDLCANPKTRKSLFHAFTA